MPAYPSTLLGTHKSRDLRRVWPMTLVVSHCSQDQNAPQGRCKGKRLHKFESHGTCKPAPPSLRIGLFSTFSGLLLVADVPLVVIGIRIVLPVLFHFLLVLLPQLRCPPLEGLLVVAQQ